MNYTYECNSEVRVYFQNNRLKKQNETTFYKLVLHLALLNRFKPFFPKKEKSFLNKLLEFFKL